jgi:hypothetical protein
VVSAPAATRPQKPKAGRSSARSLQAPAPSSSPTSASTKPQVGRQRRHPLVPPLRAPADVTEEILRIVDEKLSDEALLPSWGQAAHPSATAMLDVEYDGSDSESESDSGVWG